MNEYIVFVLIIAFGCFMRIFPRIVQHFAKKAGKRDAEKDSMSEVDFAKDKGFFRDILKDYTPVQLSYVDDFNIEPVQDVAATLLNLKLKGKIQIVGEEIQRTDNDDTELNSVETYILQNITNGKVKVLPSQIEFFAKKECTNSELIQPEKNKTEKIIKKLIKEVVIILILFSAIELILHIGKFF